MFRWLAGLFRPKHPPLVAPAKRYAGATVEETLKRLEDDCSEENVQTVVIRETFERASGLLVRYEARWKRSLLDDGETYSSYESWARLVPPNPSRGDPADAGFLVAAASAEHHKLR